jgi:formylglycine-generating enzyme required for sulfatase activity
MPANPSTLGITLTFDGESQRLTAWRYAMDGKNQYPLAGNELGKHHQAKAFQALVFALVRVARMQAEDRGPDGTWRIFEGEGGSPAKVLSGAKNKPGSPDVWVQAACGIFPTWLSQIERGRAMDFDPVDFSPKPKPPRHLRIQWPDAAPLTLAELCTLECALAERWLGPKDALELPAAAPESDRAPDSTLEYLRLMEGQWNREDLTEFCYDARAEDLLRQSQPQGTPELTRLYIDVETKTPRPRPEGEAGDKERPAPEEARAEVRYLRVWEVLNQKQHLVLLGGPGAGKSTVVRYLGVAVAKAALGQPLTCPDPTATDPDKAAPVPVVLSGLDQRPAWWLPIRVELKRVPRSAVEKGTADQLAAWLKAQATAGSQKLAKSWGSEAGQTEWLQEGRCLVLLDGLDEVEDQGIRSLLCSAIHDFLQHEKTWGRNRLLVTCRTHSYQGHKIRLKGFSEAMLRDLQPAQQRRYLEVLDAVVPPAQGQRKCAELQAQLAHPSLVKLAAVPLELANLALLHRASPGGLPKDQFELYERLVDFRLFRRDRQLKANSSHASPLEQLLEKLGQADARSEFLRRLYALSHRIHAPERNGSADESADIPAPQLVAALTFPREPRVKEEEFGGDPGKVGWAQAAVNLLERRNGLLRVEAAATEIEPAKFRLPHRRYQEFLAARHLVETGATPSQMVALLKDDDYWREVVRWAALIRAKLKGDMDAALAVVGRLADFPGAVDRCWARATLAAEIVQDLGPTHVESERWGPVTLAALRPALVAVLELGPGGEVASLTQRWTCGSVLGEIGDPRPGVAPKAAPSRQAQAPFFAWGGIIRPDPQFQMGGDPKAWKGEPKVASPIGHPFRLARYPVTVAQYAWFTRSPGFAQFKVDEPKQYGMPFGRPNHPQVGVSWHGAEAFCRWLNEGLERGEWTLADLGLDEAACQGWRLHLPVEAQWERAARHDDGRCFPWVPEEERPWLKANLAKTGWGSTSPVGLFPDGRSVCGCEDLSGNVWEWCRNTWGDPAQPYDRQIRERGGGRDVARVVRGGAWFRVPGLARAAYRLRSPPDARDYDLGFRLAASPISAL